MTTARDIMTPDATCVRESDTVHHAARTMADKKLGALPICGEDNRLKGVLTDRDIVVKVLAEGKDVRAIHVGELAQGEAVTIGADDDAEEIMRTMATHRVRRAAGDRRARPRRYGRPGRRRPCPAEPRHRRARRGTLLRLSRTQVWRSSAPKPSQSARRSSMTTTSAPVAIAANGRASSAGCAAGSRTPSVSSSLLPTAT